MQIIECIRFIVGTGLLLMGLIVFALEIFGIFKFEYILDRMHAAAMGDTLGIALSMLGLIVLNGLNFTSVKLALIIIFLWLASPVSSHLICRLEVVTNKQLSEHCELPDDGLEEELC